jgi:hypothetical protein
MASLAVEGGCRRSPMFFRFTLLSLISSAAFSQAPVYSLPAHTPVVIQLDDEISSNRNHPGDRFRLHVAEDVRVGDVVLIPAGTAGEGEVIHVQKSGMGGRAGELIVTARFVEVGGVRVRLRSFEPGARTGKQHIGASYATSVLVGLPGLLVQGGQLIMPRTMFASVKTAKAVRLPAAPTPDSSKERSTDEPTID